MANKLGIFCVRQIIKVHSRGMSKLPDSIGARDVVGYGFNGVANYMDRFDFPMPAIRFKENTPDIMYWSPGIIHFSRAPQYRTGRTWNMIVAGLGGRDQLVLIYRSYD